MIIVKNETISGIPTLHVVKAAHIETENMPAIFFLHGYTSAKEHNLHVAYLLAEKGFRVFLPDALHHGEREADLSGKERDFAFWDIVISSINELENMKSELVEEQLINASKIGVVGTSMGAITTYGALTQYPWIKSAASFMGSAYYQSFAEQQLMLLQRKGIELGADASNQIFELLRPFDLSTQLEKLAERPLFIWHGKQDEVVPYSFSEQLYEEVRGHYEHVPERLQFFADDRADHKVSRKAMLHSIQWFEDQLIFSEEHVS